jgi:protein arginine N-methyltransferase 1
MDLFSHEWMLKDPVRVDTYRRAIRRVVQSGDVVAEIGTGGGILSCFACQADASSVYAVECREIGGLAEEIARTNGFADRLQIIIGLSTNTELPKKADVIIAEILGSWALDENILGYTINARDRWL